MSFRLKFNIVLCFSFVLALLTSAMYYKFQLEKDTLEEVKHEGNFSLQAALAIRSYSSAHIKPFFDDMPSASFRPEGIPAFAAMETMRILFEKYPGYQYRETVLNPLNLNNLPREKWESDLIERFRSGQISYTEGGVIDFANDKSLYLIKPIKITESSCLLCHGQASSAPAAMVARYGNTHGYGWKFGEIVGMQTVEVPLARSIERNKQVFWHFLWPLVAVFVLLFATLNILLERTVVKPMSEANKNLSQMASTDSLTGLLNRRAFLERFDLELQTAQFHRTPLSLVVFDLDHFKLINDTYGHKKGDDVLRHASSIVSKAIRASDHFARIGGEEFALLLPRAPLVAAKKVAEQMRTVLEQQHMENLPPVTGSFGIATWDGSESPEAFLKKADDAAYASKRAGRNRVMAFGEIA